jgi:hypothetical protein
MACRSRRVGFTYYVIGQLEQIARELYHVDLDVSVVDERIEHDRFFHVTFRLKFDNSAAAQRTTTCSSASECRLTPQPCLARGRQTLIGGATFFKVNFNLSPCRSDGVYSKSVKILRRGLLLLCVTFSK